MPQKNNKNSLNFRAIAERDTNALNFDHKSWLSWESDQKGTDCESNLSNKTPCPSA